MRSANSRSAPKTKMGLKVNCPVAAPAAFSVHSYLSWKVFRVKTGASTSSMMSRRWRKPWSWVSRFLAVSSSTSIGGGGSSARAEGIPGPQKIMSAARRAFEIIG